MSRIDVPTLKCDRCGLTTQDTSEMIKFSKLEQPHMSGRDTWDLCPTCSEDFRVFLNAFNHNYIKKD